MTTPARGKSTFYPNKLKDPVTTNLTQESHDEVDRIARAITIKLGGNPDPVPDPKKPGRLKREGPQCSRSDLLEHAWRTLRGIRGNPELTKLLLEIPLPPVAETDSSLSALAEEEAPAEEVAEPEVAETAAPV